MSNRSWFCADRGQQQGPFSDAQFRQLIASGRVQADMLVWTEGMENWQRAGDIPGLMSPSARPPSVPGGLPMTAGAASGSLSIDFEILDFVKRLLLFFVGLIFVIPLPWVVVSNLKWIISCIRVPGYSDLAFTGKATTILWWWLGAIALIIAFNVIGGRLSDFLGFMVEVGLGWLGLRWVIANIASHDQPLALSFSGSYWAYLGWTFLGALSAITIIGWAWVYTAQTRWIFRNIEGTRREIVFKATGLQYLWRALVTLIGCAFIIPIPWVARWFMQWHASQVVLVERDTQ
jgi:uncharacterized protein DUF4339